MEVNSIGQMYVRLMAYVPRDLAQALHPKPVNDALSTAWQHGWRDPEWLANVALAGTGHESVRDAAAVFLTRLREAVAEQCPTIQTPTPPRELTRAPGWNPPATPESVTRWASVARAGMTAAKAGETVPSWAGDVDVDPWEGQA